MKFGRMPRVAAWSAILFAAVGLVVVAVAGWVIAAWHQFVLATPSLGVPQLQYDTAWAFVFCGAALIAYAFRLRRIGRLCASVPIALGAIRLIAYLAPGTINIHPVLAHAWLPLGAGNYNDMGVLTALVFVVLGCALASVQPAAKGPWRSVLVAQLASTALALALLMLFGAFTAAAIGSEWLLMTGGERVNSLLFIALTGALLVDRLMAGENEQQVLRRSAPVIVWLAVFVSVLVLWRALTIEETRVIQHNTSLVAADARGQVARDLEARIEMLQRLAGRTLNYPFDAELWSRDAGSLIQDVNEFQSISWATPDSIVRWVAPRSNEGKIIGYNMLSDPVRAAAVQLAIQSRSVTLTPFTEFVVGGKGVVIYAPVYDGDTLRGIAAGALGNGNWLRSLVDGRFADHSVELVENGAVVQSVAPNAPRAEGAWSEELPLDVHNVHWILRVTPTRESLRRAASGLPEIELALGIVLATLLALLTYFFQTARRRARDLKRTNLRLQGDIERRYAVEQELRQSEARTQLIINAVKDCAIFMLDSEGCIASWNRGAQALNGYTADEAIGQPISILYPPDREQPMEDELQVAARRGWFEEECWHARKDGSRYCADDIISAIREENGRLQGFSVVTRDATQRIELREETERSRDFYFALFSDFPNLVWRSDSSGACDYLNKAWLDYTGRAREAELGDGWLDGMHPDDRKRWRESFSAAFAERRPLEIEYRLRRANGEYGSMICVGRPYHDMRGGYSGYLCSCYDNSARRAMEVALRESEQRYEGMTSNVPGMVFQLARDPRNHLTFAYVSHGCEVLTGLPEAIVRADANAFINLIPAEERPHFTATLEASAAHMVAWNWSGRLKAPHEATERWINIRGKPRPGDHGDVLWDGLVYDDTQGRLAQRELERSREELRSLSRHLQSVREEEKARIAREVHDELGSTLTALRMDLDWMATRLPPDMEPLREKRSAMVKLVEAAVAATRKIVTDLRPSILDDLGLAAAVRWQASEFQKHTGVAIEVATPEQDGAIQRDTALALFRIFQETLTNVARHAKATHVWVDLTTSDAGYVLRIRDDGAGMSEKDLVKATSHGVRGMRERAQQFGGDVTVSSQPGRGTTLVASVPATPLDNQLQREGSHGGG
jgi:two-component system, NarL family, sensor histidine kinase UhpB